MPHHPRLARRSPTRLHRSLARCSAPLSALAFPSFVYLSVSPSVRLSNVRSVLPSALDRAGERAGDRAVDTDRRYSSLAAAAAPPPPLETNGGDGAADSTEAHVRQKLFNADSSSSRRSERWRRRRLQQLPWQYL